MLRSGFRVSRAILCTGAAALALSSFAFSAQAETVLRVSVDTPTNHVRNITLRDFGERLAAATDGRLKLQLFESGQLYASRDEMRAVARGDVEMVVTPNPSVSAVVPNVSVLEMPLYSSLSEAQVNQVFDGAVGAELKASIEDRLGVVVPGKWLMLGFTNTFASTRDIKSFADFKGAQIRVPGGAAYIARYNLLGAQGVSIPFPDLPVALTQGAVDGYLTSQETMRSAKLNEAGTRSAFLDKIAPVYYIPMVNKAFWKGLEDADREAFLTEWDAAVLQGREEAIKREAAAKAGNEADGITMFSPDPAELAEVSARLLTAAPEIAARLDVDAALLDLAIAEIKAVE